MGPGGVNDITHRKRGLRFEKSQLSWFLASEEDGWLSEIAWTIPMLSIYELWTFYIYVYFTYVYSCMGM